MNHSLDIEKYRVAELGDVLLTNCPVTAVTAFRIVLKTVYILPITARFPHI